MTSEPVLGYGSHRYRVDSGWARLPPGWVLEDVAAIALDAAGQVHVFGRSEAPMLVLDAAGNLLRSWGQGRFVRPHGLEIARDGSLWCTDDGGHAVWRLTPHGEPLLCLGRAGSPAPWMSGEPFHQCTHSALSPEGHIYVTDGYGNARVHEFAPDGRHVRSWGQPGIGPGEFNIPHNICCDSNGRLYVADRENHRIQIFDGEGRLLDIWHGLHRPCGMCLGHGPEAFLYVTELGPALGVNRDMPNLGPRISILDREGRIVARLGSRIAGTDPDQFVAPHGIAVDRNGDIYVGDVAATAWPAFFPDQPRPAVLPALRKLTRLESVH